MSENLDSEQRARLWEYRLHVENQLYSRMTVFLAFETILLAVVGTLYANPNLPKNRCHPESCVLVQRKQA